MVVVIIVVGNRIVVDGSSKAVRCQKMSAAPEWCNLVNHHICKNYFGLLKSQPHCCVMDLGACARTQGAKILTPWHKKKVKVLYRSSTQTICGMVI